MRLILTLLLCLPAAAGAEGYRVLAGDEGLSRAEVVAATEGRTLVFYDDGRASYAVGGAYSYAYASGATAYGRFDIAEDGEVCVVFRNGRDRCDRFVRSNGRLVLLTQAGGRFPVRP